MRRTYDGSLGLIPDDDAEGAIQLLHVSPEQLRAFSLGCSKQSFLTSICLRGVNLGNGLAREVLEPLLVKCKSLVALNLAECSLGDHDLDYRNGFMMLQTLQLCSNRIANEGAKKLALALWQGGLLTALTLDGNLIEDSGALELIRAIEKSTVLQTLSLQNNPLKKRETLLNSLVLNTSLTTVRMGFEERDMVETMDLVQRQNALFMDALSDHSIVRSSFNNRRWTRGIPSQVFQWSHMVSLNLSDNSLAELPLSVTRLENLSSLNVANNGITMHALPVHLMALPKLEKLSVRGNPFLAELPANVVWRECAALLNYFKAMAMDLDEVDMGLSLRVLVMGDAQVGKTTMVRTLEKHRDTKLLGAFKRLVRDQFADKTVREGIQLTRVKVGREDQSLCFWDFAGYVDINQFFLLPNSVFVVCFSLIANQSLQRVEHWIEMVLSKVGKADVIIVGTHKERCANFEDVLKSVRAKYTRMKNVTLHAVFALNAKQRGSVDPLLQEIAKLGQAKSFENLRHAPKSFWYLRSLVKNNAAGPMLRIHEFHRMCELCFITDKSRAMAFLRSTGDVMWYDRIPSLSGWLFCDPTWLISLMLRILDTKGSFQDEDVPVLWPGYLYKTPEVLLDILASFELVHRMRYVSASKDLVSRYVVPCILPHEEPLNDVGKLTDMIDSTTKCLSLCRIYRFPFLPPGFMAQMSVRLVHLSTLHGAIWRNGAVTLLEEDDGTRHLLSVRLVNETDVELDVTTPDWSGKIMHLLVSATESLIRGWFPSSVYTRHIRMSTGGEASVDELLQTLMSISSQRDFYRLSGTIKKYESVAPDLLLRRTKRIRPEEFEIRKEIGSGAFGSVFVATYQDTTVVVKELRDLSLASIDTFGTFQNECFMMTFLKHEKVIQLIGICLHPIPSLVMELMVFGDVRHFLDSLTDQSQLPWELRIKICIDIAEGMNFSHRLRPAIIHRDLKSPNVFLSRNADGTLVAKVADLGLAVVLAKDHKESAVDNVLWLAPEAIERNVCDEKVDVYAMGIIMSELMSFDFPFAARLNVVGFMSVLGDEIVAGLRPSSEVFAPSGYKNLMRQCWNHQPNKRPSFRSCLRALCQLQQGGTFGRRSGVQRTLTRSASRGLEDCTAAPILSLSDFGSLDAPSIAPILSFDVGADSVFTLHLSGTVSRINLSTGIGEKIAELPVPAVVNFEGQMSICGGAGEGACFNSRGRVFYKASSEPLVELTSDIVRVAFFANLASAFIIVGYTENTLTSCICEVRSPSTLQIQSRMTLFNASQSVLSHCIVHDDEIWVLYLQDGAHRILKLAFNGNGGDKPNIGSVTVPPDRYPHRLASVGGNGVWGLGSTAVMCWKADGAFLQSFDPAKAAAPVTSLGLWLDACLGPDGTAIVTSTQAVSLWNVRTRKLLSHYSATACPRVWFDLERMQGLVSGRKLRILGIVKGVSSEPLAQQIQMNPADGQDVQVASQESFATATLSLTTEDETDPDVRALTLPSLSFPMVRSSGTQSSTEQAEEDDDSEGKLDNDAGDRLCQMFEDLVAGRGSVPLQASEPLEPVTQPVLYDELERSSKHMRSLLELSRNSSAESENNYDEDSSEVEFLSREAIEDTPPDLPPVRQPTSFRASQSTDQGLHRKSNVVERDACSYSGVLMNKGKKKKLSQRYFELVDTSLLFYKSKAMTASPKGKISLQETASIEVVGEQGMMKFILTMEQGSASYELSGSVAEVENWIRAILEVRCIETTANEVAQGYADYFNRFPRSNAARRRSSPRLGRTFSISTGRSPRVKSSIGEDGAGAPSSPPKSPSRSPRDSALKKVTSFLSSSGGNSSSNRSRSGGKLNEKFAGSE